MNSMTRPSLPSSKALELKSVIHNPHIDETKRNETYCTYVTVHTNQEHHEHDMIEYYSYQRYHDQAMTKYQVRTRKGKKKKTRQIITGKKPW